MSGKPLVPSVLTSCDDMSVQTSKDTDARQKLQQKLARVEQQIKEEQARRQQQAAVKAHKVGLLT